MFFFNSLPVPELREWNDPFPFPFPNSQMSFPLTPDIKEEEKEEEEEEGSPGVSVDPQRQSGNRHLLGSHLVRESNSNSNSCTWSQIYKHFHQRHGSTHCNLHLQLVNKFTSNSKCPKSLVSRKISSSAHDNGNFLLGGNILDLWSMWGLF